MSLLVLCGCAGFGPAQGLTADEVAGTWTVSDPRSDTTLTLNPDGTFVLSGWPTDLLCTTDPATSVSDVNWGDVIEIADDWEQGTGEYTYKVVLDFPQDQCASGVSADLFRNVAGDLKMRIFVDPLLDPDVASEDDIVTLRRVP